MVEIVADPREGDPEGHAQQDRLIGNSVIALQADILNYLGEGAEGFQDYSDVFSGPVLCGKPSSRACICRLQELVKMVQNRLNHWESPGQAQEDIPKPAGIG